MPGERLHPTSAGVKGSKPRERIRKLPAAEIEEASRVYLQERNLAMRLRRMREGMLLALERDQLISKELALKQLAFLCVSFRQELLALPQRIGARILQKTRDPELARTVAGEVKEAVHETLHTLAKFPQSVEPGWLERLEEEEG